MKRLTSLVFVAAMAVALAACTGQSSASSTAPTSPSPAPPAPAPSSPTVTNVTVSGAADVGSFQLVAMAERSDHTIENATAGAIWASSNSSIARVAAGGYVTVMQNGAVDFTATYQGVTGSLHATVSMPKTYTVSGVVTDSATGAVIANARVQLLGDSSETMTDMNGKFTLNNVPSGRSLIEFTATGYDVAEKDVSVAENITLSVALNATKQQS